MEIVERLKFNKFVLIGVYCAGVHLFVKKQVKYKLVVSDEKLKFVEVFLPKGVLKYDIRDDLKKFREIIGIHFKIEFHESV